MISSLLSTRCILFFLIVFSSNLGFSQDSLASKASSSNIIYGDFFLGGARKGIESGVLYGVELCHQRKNHLLTFRYTVNPRKTIDGRVLWVFNNVTERRKDRETAFLYGFREIKKGASWNASVGISINRYIKTDHTQNEPRVVLDYYHVGLPYEFSIKFFKAKKRRYWVVIPLGPIPIPFPVGKPTSFGRSVGFKFFGNVSKRSYLGFGVSYGWGVHRKY